MNKIFPYLLLLIFFTSCNRFPKRVQKALDGAGKNSSELEKVISHYSSDPKDSLKLRAAYFLIENMGSHYSNGGQEAEKQAHIYREIGKVPVNMRNDLQFKLTESLKVKNYYTRDLDLQKITSKYLIRHIDESLIVWQSSPWSKNYAFDIFCEYILPYRLDNEKLTNWMGTINNRYKGKLEKIEFDAGAIYEAEKALISNCGMRSYPSFPAEKLAYMAARNKSAIEFNNIMNTDGENKILCVRYSKGGKPSELSLIINGKQIQIINFYATGKWEELRADLIKIPVKLQPGLNSIKFVSETQDVAIDYIEVIGSLDYKITWNKSIDPKGVYKIQNKDNNLLLSINGNSDQNLASLTAEKDNNGLHQQFKPSYENYGFFKLYPMHIKGKAKTIDVLYCSKENGAPIIIWDNNTGHNQEWAIISVNDGYYKIVNKFSGKCLQTVKSSGSNYTVEQHDYTGKNAQKWKFDLQKKFDHDTGGLRRGSTFEAACRITDFTNDFQYTSIGSIPHVNAIDLINIKTGKCPNETRFLTFISRSLGIPVTVDFTPHWPHRSLGHEWNVLFDTKGKAIRYYFKDKPGKHNRFDDYPKAKVFRKRFSENPESLAMLKSEDEQIPTEFENPHVIDVTQEYVKTSDVTVALKAAPKNIRFAYLCTFDNREWVPSFWGRIESDRVRFKNMGRNVVYLPQYYINGQFKAAGDPFLLDKNGNVSNLKPNKSKGQLMVLFRKHPFFTYDGYSPNYMNGGKFQGANKADFSDSVTLNIFKGSINGEYQDISITSDKKFKYLRYLGPDNSRCNINELSFFDVNGKELLGEPIGAKNSGTGIKNCFDKDILTGFEAPFALNAWVGLKLKSPAKISKLRFMPRTDGNCIEPGDEYQLVYWNNETWEIIGTRTAQDGFLKFDKVPASALYLLHNLTKGTEERIFTYSKNSQVWW